MADTKEDRPVFNVGDILVTSMSNGKDSFVHFYKVVSHTTSGAPRVVELKTTREKIHSDAYSSSHKITPGFEALGGPKAMRWNKGGYYALAKDKPRGACSTTFTELYDPQIQRFENWLSP